MGTIAGTLTYRQFCTPWAARAFDRIELGMSVAEVEAMVGMPPTVVITTHEALYEYGRRNPETREKRVVRSAGDWDRFAPGDTMRFWHGPEYGIETVHDKEGKIYDKVLVLYYPPLLDHLRRWLGFSGATP